MRRPIRLCEGIEGNIRRKKKKKKIGSNSVEYNGRPSILQFYSQGFGPLGQRVRQAGQRFVTAIDVRVEALAFFRTSVVVFRMGEPGTVEQRQQEQRVRDQHDGAARSSNTEL